MAYDPGLDEEEDEGVWSPEQADREAAQAETLSRASGGPPARDDWSRPERGDEAWSPSRGPANPTPPQYDPTEQAASLYRSDQAMRDFQTMTPATDRPFSGGAPARDDWNRVSPELAERQAAQRAMAWQTELPQTRQPGYGYLNMDRFTDRGQTAPPWAFGGDPPPADYLEQNPMITPEGIYVGPSALYGRGGSGRYDRDDWSLTPSPGLLGSPGLLRAAPPAGTAPLPGGMGQYADRVPPGPVSGLYDPAYMLKAPPTEYEEAVRDRMASYGTDIMSDYFAPGDAEFLQRELDFARQESQRGRY